MQNYEKLILIYPLTELFAHSSSDKWFGLDLNPVTTMDPIAVCLRLNQPVFVTGELHMKPFSEKEQQLAVYTVVNFFSFLPF